jgi:four helix bundle protein
MVNKIKSYQKVEEVPVWEKSHELALEIYKFTRIFPKSEIYGITSQLRRAAVSVPANISEGFYRGTHKQLIQFLYNSRGSLGEVVYYLRLAKDLGYLNAEEYKLL